MKIYTASPLPLTRDSWTRDITSLYRGFAQLGHEAQCVRLHSTDGSDYPGILQVSLVEMLDPDFWSRQSCDLVVANTWGMPKFTPLVEAIRKSGSKVFVRLDTDGCNSPWAGLLRYARTGFFSNLDKGMSRAGALLKTFLKLFLFSIPSVYDRKMLDHLDRADGIGIESEGARRLFARILKRHRRMDLLDRLHVVPHPVAPEMETYTETPMDKRRKRCVAVGRWGAYQKNFPLLADAALKAFGNENDFELIIVGNGASDTSWGAGLKNVLRERVEFIRAATNEEVKAIFSNSMVCVISSRFESGPIIAAEALCCGCSIACCRNLPSLEGIISASTGSASPEYSPRGLAMAMGLEMNLWRNGERSPEWISTFGRARFTPEVVCKSILNTIFVERDEH